MTYVPYPEAPPGKSLNLGFTIDRPHDEEEDDIIKMAQDFRKDYDAIMDAVHYLSIMLGTPHEEDALARLKKTYQKNQDKWGG